MEDSEETVSSRHNRMDAHSNSNRQTVAAHTKAARGQDRQGPSIERGSIHEVSPPN